MMNDEFKRRFEHQLYLAKENPEPLYDVSKCGLSMVPVGCFSLCKVLRKKKLFLNNNRITLLNSNNNNVEDLTVLTHLYLEYNEITKLPNNINDIQYLQILNISHNKLTCIPDSIENLLYLRELYIIDNQIGELPIQIFKLNSNMEIIDVSENEKFSLIPIEIINLPKIRKFGYSAKYLKYPSQKICEEGIIEILKVLCKDKRIQLQQSFIDQISNYENINSDVVDSSILDYEQFKRDRLNFLEFIAKDYDQRASYHKSFADKAMNDQIAFIEKLAEEEAKITNEISRMNRDRDQHRKQLINDFKATENDAANLIEEIMAINKSCQKQERFLDEIENKTMKKYQLYKVSKDEFENLRRQEILNSMSQMLISQDIATGILQDLQSSREKLKQNLSKSHADNDKALSELFNERLAKQNKIIKNLENEENEQKLAFRQLQLQKDIRMLRISEHIYSVESELILLSQVEQKKRAEQMDFKFNILNERRQQLLEMLEHLVQQKELRERIISQRLLEMEEQRQHDQNDFWLIQYQRCLDTKPHCFWDKNNGLESSVMELLHQANATEYLPFLLRHKVTWNQIEKFQEKDWKELGIHNKVLLKNLHEITKMIKKEQEKKIQTKENSKFSKSLEFKTDRIDSMLPQIITSHRETECCICLNEETTILFLSCGHICCCESCSNGLKECPICRNDISRMVKLACW